MVAQRSLRRRPLFLVLTTSLIILLIYALGPPIFTPTSAKVYKEKAQEWATSLSTDMTAIYHPSSSASSEVHRIRQATMLYEGDKDHLRNMYERAVATHLKHGERWGVPTHILKQYLVEPGSYFNKPAWLLNLVMNEMSKPKDRRTEWVVWFDADSVIMNSEIPWSVYLPPADFGDKHILATRDNNGFNAGMLMLRVHEWTVNMLAEVLALKALVPDTDLPFYDQSAIYHICDRPGYAEHFIYQPRRWWNRYHHDKDGEEKGNMLIHFAGIGAVNGGYTEKQRVMTKFLEGVEQKPEEWAKSLKETGREMEIEDYWNVLRKSRKLLEKAKGSKKEGKIETKDTAVDERFRDLVHVVLKWADDAGKLSEANTRLEKAMGGEK